MAKTILLPELVDPYHRRWSVHEVGIRQSSVDLENARAYVPRPYTVAQKLARLHELGHVKQTPVNWRRTVLRTMRWAEENGEEVDPGVALRISKMLEENRIDYILWRFYDIDLRPAREVFEWADMPVPNDPLMALEWVLQLAWTVWASRGFGAPVFKAPPVRDPDPAAAEFFDTCWQVVYSHPRGAEITMAIVSGCLEMYKRTPKKSDAQRDRVAAELAVFFQPPKQTQPDEKEEEQEEQERAKEQEQLEDTAQAAAKEREEGVQAVDDIRPETRGFIQIHDHTRAVRRTSARIARRDRPTDTGVRLAFPQRYVLDGQVFARRTLNEAGIIIDNSGSMNWTNEMMRELIDLMPAVNIGLHGAYADSAAPAVVGRICILARAGRIARWKDNEPRFTGGNGIDVQALEYLGKWPGPRFWISDGYVNGGPLGGPHPNAALNTTHYLRREGRIVYNCDRLMRQYGILRVPDVSTMRRLLRRQAVTLYKTCVNTTFIMAAPLSLFMVFGGGARYGYGGGKPAATKEERTAILYPPDMREEPVRYQL